MLGFASFLSLALEEHVNTTCFTSSAWKSFMIQSASLNGVARPQLGNGSFALAHVLRDCSLPLLEKHGIAGQEASAILNNHLCLGRGWGIFSFNWLLSVPLNHPLFSVKQRNQEPAKTVESLYWSLFRWIKVNLAYYNARFSAQENYCLPCFEHVISQTHDFQLSMWWWVFPLGTCASAPLLKKKPWLCSEVRLWEISPACVSLAARTPSSLFISRLCLLALYSAGSQPIASHYKTCRQTKGTSWEDISLLC